MEEQQNLTDTVIIKTDSNLVNEESSEFEKKEDRQEVTIEANTDNQSDALTSVNPLSRKNTHSVSLKVTKEEGDENLKVFIRVRPAIDREIDPETIFRSIVEITDDKKNLSLVEYLGSEMKEKTRQIELVEKPNLFQYHRFTFDKVFDMDSTQQEVYERTAKPAIESLLEGYNSTLFAYGQTGTGKTYTMEGYTKNSYDEGRGIIPRSIEEIFTYIESLSTNTKFMVRASYLQIYNETINDLLKADKTNLQIREDKKKGVFVDGLSEWSVQKPIDVYNLLKKGSGNRAISYTKMNDVSSRSHAVFVVTVEQLSVNEGSTQIKVGKLNLVDLAGSERSKSSGVTGKQMDECKKINKSLSCLGNVIYALTDNKNRSHIPYRDSKLTRLLEDSLGGNCKTTMMAMISPSQESFSETLSTLLFAKRAKTIKNKAKVNEDYDNKTLIRKYELELKKLREMLGEKSSHMNNDLFNQLEDQKNQAEEEKKSALAALDEAGKKYIKEREERKLLEKKIQMMSSQMVSAGHRIEETPQFKTALENQHNLLVKEFDKKIQELTKGRQQEEEEKAQVERYKTLLLKQRDIMIALTNKLNERDDAIEQLHEEIDAYDKINREQEEIIDDKNTKLEILSDLFKTHNLEIPEQFESLLSSNRKTNLRKGTLQEMVFLGGNESDKFYDYDIRAQLTRSEEKITDLNNIIADQEKEIELLKYFTSSTTVITSQNQKQSTSKDLGKNYLKTIEENDENNYLRKKELEDLTEKYEDLEKKYENLVEEKQFTANKIKIEIKSLVDKLITKLSAENIPKTSLINRDLSFIYKSIVNLIDDNYNPDESFSTGFTQSNLSSRNNVKDTDDIKVQIHNNNININNYAKFCSSSPRSPRIRHTMKTDSPTILNKSPPKSSCSSTLLEKVKQNTQVPPGNNIVADSTPSKKIKGFNQTFNMNSKFSGQPNQKTEEKKGSIIKNTKADPQKIIKNIKMGREKDPMTVTGNIATTISKEEILDTRDQRDVREQRGLLDMNIRDLQINPGSSNNLPMFSATTVQGGTLVRSNSVTREPSDKNLRSKNPVNAGNNTKFDMSSTFFKQLHELSSTKPSIEIKNITEVSSASNTRKSTEVISSNLNNSATKFRSENLERFTQQK